MFENMDTVVFFNGKGYEGKIWQQLAENPLPSRNIEGMYCTCFSFWTSRQLSGKYCQVNVLCGPSALEHDGRSSCCGLFLRALMRGQQMGDGQS